MASVLCSSIAYFGMVLPHACIEVITVALLSMCLRLQASALVLVIMRIFPLPPLKHRSIDEEWLTYVKILGAT